MVLKNIVMGSKMRFLSNQTRFVIVWLRIRYFIFMRLTAKRIILLLPSNGVQWKVRDRTLSMQERAPEGFTNFSKKNLQPRRRESYIFHGPVVFSENILWPLPSILASYLRISCNSISGQYSQNQSNFKSLKNLTFTIMFKKMIFI